MDNFLASLVGLTAIYPFLKYVIVGIATMIQGETGIILFVFLFSRDRFGWLVFFFVALIAIVIYEISVYSLGRALRGTKLGQKIEGRIKNHEKIEKFLNGNGNSHIIALSKFVAYFSLAIVFLSGWTKMKFRRFIKLRLLGAVLWLVLMLAVLYVLVSVFGLIAGEKLIKYLEEFVLVVVLLIIIFSRVVGKLIEKKIFAKDSNQAS